MSESGDLPMSLRDDQTSWRRLAYLLRPFTPSLVMILIMLLALAGLNMIMPAYFIKLLFDDVLPGQGNPGGNIDLLWLILPGILVVYVIRNVMYLMSKLLAARVGENVSFDLRNRLFERLQQMNLHYYRKQQAGKMSSRVMDDSFVIQTFIQDELPKMLQAGFLFLGLVAVLYAVNWQLALASTIVLPFHLAAFYYFRRPMKQASRKAREQISNVHGNLIEKMLNIELVKGFTAEDRENRAFQDATAASRKNQLRMQTFHITQKVVADLLVGLGVVGLLGFGAYQVLGPAQMSKGVLMGFFMLVVKLYPTVLELIAGFSKLTKTTASVDRVFELLQSGQLEDAPGGARTRHKPIRGRLELRSVSFRYPDGPPILKQVNLTVEPGQVCAIVGSSGVGKTTLVSLVPRFIDPTLGRILLDGLDLREYDLRYLRSQVGIAFQECFLFNSSILENLRYAHPQADMDQIIEVAKRTGAHDMIMRQPDGYDTLLGEGGVTLSRGEKQRISLTRAMLKTPRVLILDEATASLDPASESMIIPSILQFMKGKTTLMVTHRPELLRHAHIVAQVVAGSLVIKHQKPAPIEHDPDPDRDFQDLAEQSESDEADPAGDTDQTGQVGSQATGPAGGHAGGHVREAGATGSAVAWSRGDAAAPNADAGDPGDSSQARAELDDPNQAGAKLDDPIQARAELDDPNQARAELDDPSQRNAIAQGISGDVAESDIDVNEPDHEMAAEDPEADHEAGAEDPEADDDARTDARAEGRPARVPGRDVGKRPSSRGRSLPLMWWLIALGLICGSVMSPNHVLAEEPAADNLPAPEAPASGHLIAQPATFDDGTLREIVSLVSTQIQAQWGYRADASAPIGSLPVPPNNIRKLHTLVQQSPMGTRLVQLGYIRYVSQAPRIWLVATTVAPQGALPNEHLDAIRKMVQDAAGMIQKKPEQLKLTDLAHKRVKLSYVDLGRCINMLRLFGFSIGQANAPVNAKALPVVVPAAGTAQHNVVGGPGSNFPLTEADPINDLLVFYDPARPEQFAMVYDKIRSLIDVPSQQIMIEAMVLEISETGLEQLGVQWQLANPEGNLASLRIGRLPTFNITENQAPSLDVGLIDIFGEFNVQIQALVQSGEAEVLSRPKILALDGRMAYIDVSEKIPTVRSISNPNANTTTVGFGEANVGITLTVRPHLSADKEEISMQVAARVSAQVPNADVVVRNNQGEEVARSPTISSREVRTYTRIANNTPFIVGGLIAEDDTVEKQKTPLLGEIPLLGALFNASRRERLKREVIIVITPRVLPENQLASPALPQDEDAFDSFGNELSRDAYRIRAEDVFDLSFLRQNPRLLAGQSVVDRLVRQNQDLKDTYPFSEFTDQRFPGESILVLRQMYEVIKRRDIDDQVSSDKVIFFEPGRGEHEAFDVSFLTRFLSKVAKQHGQQRGGEFQSLHDKAVVMTYTKRPKGQVQDIFRQPVPDVRIVDCPDRGTWSKLLWQWNQPDQQGRPRSSLVIQNRDDLRRINRAIVLKHTVDLNADEDNLTLTNFTLGRLLLMPTIKPDKVYVLDERTARYFFFTEQYYPAVIRELERDADALRAALQEMGLVPPGERGDRSAPAESGEPAASDDPAAEPAGTGKPDKPAGASSQGEADGHGSQGEAEAAVPQGEMDRPDDLASVHGLDARGKASLACSQPVRDRAVNGATARERAGGWGAG